MRPYLLILKIKDKEMSKNEITKDSQHPRRIKFTPIQDYRLKPVPSPTSPKIVVKENKTKTPTNRVRAKPSKTKSLATVVSLPKQPTTIKKQRKTSSSARKSISRSLIYFLRVSIFGIAIAAIAGTVLSHSTKYTQADAQAQKSNENRKGISLTQPTREIFSHRGNPCFTD